MANKKKYQVRLSTAQREILKELTSSGTIKVRVYVQRIQRQFVQEGMEVALNEKARSGSPRKFNERDRAKITALACAEPPQGYARWTLRLLAEKMVELELVESISHDTVDKVLKKTNLSLTSNDNGVWGS
jgi:putative transposase